MGGLTTKMKLAQSAGEQSSPVFLNENFSPKERKHSPFMV